MPFLPISPNDLAKHVVDQLLINYTDRHCRKIQIRPVKTKARLFSPKSSVSVKIDPFHRISLLGIAAALVPKLPFAADVQDA
jgi:hypothetical protein